MSIYLQIPNVTGESTAEGYAGQFQAISLLWGGGSTLLPGDKRSYTTSLTAVSVSKLATMNSPTLMLLMVNQKKLGSVVITISKVVSSKNVPVQVYTLSNALLTSVSQSCSGGEPVEDMSFSFSRVTYQQLYYDSAGSKTGEETHYWDLATNKGA